MMKLQGILRRALPAIAGVAALGIASTALTESVSAQETLVVGAIQPQAGDCGQWGIPITRGVQIWADQLNADGGLLAGDGKRYMIEVKAYDNVCYIPGEELKAGRRAILDDQIKFMLQTFTPGSRQAIADMTTEHHVLTTSYGAGYLSADHPYLNGGITGSPASYMLIASRALTANPDAKKVAIITADSSFGIAAKAYFEAGVAAHPDQAEIVYNESYAPDATKDMLGLLTPLMASEPDMICQLGFVPAQLAIMIETVEQLGFKGVYCAEGFTMPLILKRVSAEALAGRMYSGYAFEASEPTFSAKGHELYKTYVEQYGEAEWSPYTPIGYAAMGTIEAAIKMSPSIDSKVVMETLYAAETVDHPIFGPSKWGGKEIYGANHHLLTPLPIYNLGADGNLVLDAVVDHAGWWEKNMAVALPILDAGGQVYK
jgi:branched-chain amino acid transport system substrate-binding protein